MNYIYFKKVGRINTICLYDEIFSKKLISNTWFYCDVKNIL